ncbi:MAG: NPCBM/NEW2 domain-containing protein [Oscillospiraceae bacterium]|nr:NPCBM/NEW2 domain-containing protein [Oscillospiraceae bacterium]
MSAFVFRNNKALSEGAQTISGDGGIIRNGDAALFTQITADTEAWKEEPRKTSRAPLTDKQRLALRWSAVAVAAALAAIVLILYIQPVNRVIRAVKSGDYAGAKELYWNSSLASGGHETELRSTLLSAADLVCEQYAGHEIDADTAASALSALGSIGMNAQELLSEHFDEFRTYTVSQNHMAQAELLSRDGDYLAARAEYMQVLEEDASYDAAQRSAARSLEQYADDIMRQADFAIQTRDYGEALSLLEKGRQTLLTYDVYNEKLEYKLNATYGLYEESLLDKAAALAAVQDYSAAASLLREGMERFDYETEALTAAEAEYLSGSRYKTVAEAALEADTLYLEGSYSEAFALLDGLQDVRELPQEAVKEAVTALENRFAADVAGRAATLFAGSRETIPEAVAVLDDAIRVRALAELTECREAMVRYLPASLYDMEYSEKTGSIFRSSGDFEALDGVTYSSGWLWGEDGAAVSYILNGNYDLLEGTFAVRRDDDSKVSGSFEILCDGETVYTSETLTHPTEESIPVSLDISGCETLTLRFHNDYTVRTAEDGYCYHGLCSPVITKNLD